MAALGLTQEALSEVLKQLNESSTQLDDLAGNLSR